MKKAILLTHNGLELPCVVLPVKRSLFPFGTEVLVYCQNRLVKGYIEDDEDFVAEIEVVVDFCIMPELDEFLKDQPKVEEKEEMYVQSTVQWY
jgi:hypothetical protein